MNLDKAKLIALIKKSIKEDVGREDITTNSLIPRGLNARAVIIAKQKGVIAGVSVAGLVFRCINRNIKFKARVKDGARVKKNQVIARLEGNARAILLGERTALNFLGKLSGIASETNEFAQKVKPYKARITDTRKTTPGLRRLEKYAVKQGGGHNHRRGLWDQVLIKDNHIKLSRGAAISDIIKLVRKKIPKGMKLEIEVSNLRQLEAALKAKPDIIMLDNMTIQAIKKAVGMRNARGRRPLLEVSGGINLKNVGAYARTGVDMISIGALTHSAKSLDVALKVL